jgi:hypothetical protein
MSSRLSKAFWTFVAVPAVVAAFLFLKLLQGSRERRREMARLNAEARARQHRRRAIDRAGRP